MKTLYTYRLLIVVPENIVPDFSKWWQENIDSNDDLSTWPTKNVTGDIKDPVTHRIANGSFTDTEFKLINEKIAELGTKLPPEWNKLDEDSKIKWLDNNKTDIFSVSGIYTLTAKNDSNIWPDKKSAELAVNIKDIKQSASEIVLEDKNVLENIKEIEKIA